MYILKQNSNFNYMIVVTKVTLNKRYKYNKLIYKVKISIYLIYFAFIFYKNEICI